MLRSCATMPGAPRVPACFWIQKVSLVTVNVRCTNSWSAGNLRSVAPSQSLPTPYTSEPFLVVVSETSGAPLDALAAAEAPTPALPAKVMIASDIGVPSMLDLAVTLTSDRRSDVVAVQISDVPASVFARETSVHTNPPPVTDTVCPPVNGNSSAATNATSVSPATAVLNGPVDASVSSLSANTS